MNPGGPKNSTNARSDEDSFNHDPRVYLAIHPDDAEKIFQSQSSYGKNLTSDFRENVKALSQVYISIQRYLQGAYRRDDSYFPELSDIHKDLQIYKRSVSDKIPMPNDQELDCMCLQLAAQEPPFIHIIRELIPGSNNEIEFRTIFVAPTSKHPDKVIVAYRSALDTSLKSLRTIMAAKKIAPDYKRLYGPIKSINEIPLKIGRADEAFKKMYLSEKNLGSVKQHDLINLRKVNQEIYKRIFKQLLLQAIRDKLLLNFSNDSVRKAGFSDAEKIYDLVLFMIKQDLQNRYEALTPFLQPKFSESLIDKAHFEDLKHKESVGELDIYECNMQLAELAYQNALSQDPPNLNAIAYSQEIKHLSQWLKVHSEKSKQSEEQSELQKTLKKIRDHGNIMRGRSNGKWNISEKYLKMILQGRIPHVLATTDPYVNLDSLKKQDFDLEPFNTIYLLYKDRKITAKAIETALNLYNDSNDTYTLHTIENLLGIGFRNENELKEYVAPAYLDQLRHALANAYVAYLPFWQRLWVLISSSQAKGKQIQKIRSTRRRESDQRIKKSIQQTQKQSQAAKIDVKEAVRQKAEEAHLSDAENRVFKELIEYLDSQWELGKYPTAPEIISSNQNHTEEYRKLIGLINAGAASVKKVVCIQNNVESVYGSRDFMQKHKEEILAYLENKITEKDSTIQHLNRTMTAQTLGRENMQIEIYKAIVNLLKLRL